MTDGNCTRARPGDRSKARRLGSRLRSSQGKLSVTMPAATAKRRRIDPTRRCGGESLGCASTSGGLTSTPGSVARSAKVSTTDLPGDVDLFAVGQQLSIGFRHHLANGQAREDLGAIGIDGTHRHWSDPKVPASNHEDSRGKVKVLDGDRRYRHRGMSGGHYAHEDLCPDGQWIGRNVVRLDHDRTLKAASGRTRIDGHNGPWQVDPHQAGGNDVSRLSDRHRLHV